MSHNPHNPNNTINGTRLENYVTMKLGNCHFDLSKPLLQNAGMDVKEYVTEIEIKGIRCAPVCIMDLDKIILHKVDRSEPEIVKRLSSIYEICVYLGLTHVPWNRSYTIKEWIDVYPFLPEK
jgi:hypothetical protein